jgi:hypothetical protein
MSKTILGAALAAATIFASMSIDLVGGQALAAVVSVTESQVRNVCGSALQSNGGAIGCRKGATDYNCYKGKCQAISRAAGSSGNRSGGSTYSQ